MGADATERKEPKTFKSLAGIILPVLLLVLATGALLRMLKDVPDYVQPMEKNVVYYQSIEDAEKALKLHIMVPSYFPDYLAWPPAGIRSERKPRFKIALRFKYRHLDRYALTIEQSAEEWRDKMEAIPAAEPWHKKEIIVNDSPGELASWMDKQGFWRYRARWTTQGRYFEAESDLPEGEFLRIINSIFK